MGETHNNQQGSSYGYIGDLAAKDWNTSVISLKKQTKTAATTPITNNTPSRAFPQP